MIISENINDLIVEEHDISMRLYVFDKEKEINENGLDAYWSNVSKDTALTSLAYAYNQFILDTSEVRLPLFEKFNRLGFTEKERNHYLCQTLDMYVYFQASIQQDNRLEKEREIMLQIVKNFAKQELPDTIDEEQSQLLKKGISYLLDNYKNVHAYFKQNNLLNHHQANQYLTIESCYFLSEMGMDKMLKRELLFQRELLERVGRTKKKEFLDSMIDLVNSEHPSSLIKKVMLDKDAPNQNGQSFYLFNNKDFFTDPLFSIALQNINFYSDVQIQFQRKSLEKVAELNEHPNLNIPVITPKIKREMLEMCMMLDLNHHNHFKMKTSSVQLSPSKYDYILSDDFANSLFAKEKDLFDLFIKIPVQPEFDSPSNRYQTTYANTIKHLENEYNNIKIDEEKAEYKLFMKEVFTTLINNNFNRALKDEELVKALQIYKMYKQESQNIQNPLSYQDVYNLMINPNENHNFKTELKNNDIDTIYTNFKNKYEINLPNNVIKEKKTSSFKPT